MAESSHASMRTFTAQLMTAAICFLSFPFTSCGTNTVRRYVLLPDAVQVAALDGPEARTLVVKCLSSEDGIPSAATAELQDGGTIGVPICSTILHSGCLTGEVRLAGTVSVAAGMWHFSVPFSTESDEGAFNGEQSGHQIAGVARVLSVYDVDGGPNGRSLRAWIPPGSKPVSGIFIWGNGAGGDSREEVTHDAWISFCRLHRFALVATAFYDQLMDGPDGACMDQQLAAVEKLSGHSELKRAPVIFTGHSNGGQMAWEYNAAIPERVIAFTISKGGSYPTQYISAAAWRNPAIFVVGGTDTVGRQRAIMGLFDRHRPKGAPWAVAIEPDTTHDFGRAQHLWLPFFEWAVETRLPAETQEPVKTHVLRPVDLTRGWYVIFRDRRGEPAIGPASKITAPIANTCWLPNWELVLAYVGFTAIQNPLVLTIKPDRGAFRANDLLTLKVTAFGSSPWRKVQIVVDGAVVGGVSPERPQLSVSVPTPGVYTACAIGQRMATDARIVSGPVSWVVESR